jgi:hypothetical protein
MLGDALRQASIAALVSTFIGVVPLAMGIMYAISPSEQRLALMRPLSLAAIFGAISGTTLGFVNVLVGIVFRNNGTFTTAAFVGLAESLVPILFGFGCLMLGWLSVAVGMWRRP